MNSMTDETWTVEPTPVLCVKFRGGQKTFINLCVCPQLPPPGHDIDEDELVKILESPDPTSYRVPLSVGEIHSETDRSGETCLAVDIIINDEFYTEKVKESELFRTFLILVAVDAIRDKHQLTLDKQNWTLLKNRKCVGDVGPQKIRKKPYKPLVEEICESSIETTESQVSRSLPEPSYRLVNKIRQEDNRGIIEASVKLENVNSMSEIDLKVNEDRIVLKVSEKYLLDIFIPILIADEEVTSYFDCDTGLLKIILPCQE